LRCFNVFPVVALSVVDRHRYQCHFKLLWATKSLLGCVADVCKRWRVG
jgi:hypothetical protein